MVKPQASAETSTIETAGSAGAAAAKPVEEEAGSFERMLPDIIGRIASFSPFSERADTLHGIAAAAGQKVSLQTAQISNTGNEFASLQEAIDTWVTIPEPDADVLDALMRSLGIQASYSPTDLSSLRLHAASEAHLTQLMRFFAVRFPNIEALDLIFHPVSPEAIRALGQLKHLRSFEVRHATLGDAHLAAIATLKSLTRLSFGVGSQATAAGYRHLQELPELRSLSLPNTRGDLAFLRGLPQMVHLELANCGLTDDHLAHLEPLTELKQLTLSLNPQITDKGIQDHLCHMTKMETLLVDGTACTKGGVEVLRFLQGRDT